MERWLVKGLSSSESVCQSHVGFSDQRRRTGRSMGIERSEAREETLEKRGS